MAFRQNGSLNPHGGPILRSEIISAAITVVEGDAVMFTSGFVALGTTGSLLLGNVVAIQTNYGVGLETTGVAGADTGTFAGSYLTSSTNTTVAKVRAVVDISKDTLYSAELDATIGTTTGSNLAGYKIDIVDEDTLSESSTTTTTCQYNTWGADPLDSTKAVVNLYESQVFGV